MTLQELVFNQPDDTPTFYGDSKNGYYFRARVLSTKQNNNGWLINKTTGHKNIKDAIDKPFAIIPELISKTIQDGHYFPNKSHTEAIAKYTKKSYGGIKQLLGPFYYEDSPTDYYYDGIVQLDPGKDKVAATLINTLAKTQKVPFGVSPHIFGEVDSNGFVTDWKFCGLCLVGNPAYGNESTIKGGCTGALQSCTRHLDKVASILEIAAGEQDSEEDKIVLSYLSSLVDKIASSQTDNIMSANPTNAAVNIPETKDLGTFTTGLPGQPDKDGKVFIPDVNTNQAVNGNQETVTIPKAEYETFKSTQKDVESIKQERKLEILSQIFSDIKDEKQREEQIKEYSKRSLEEVKLLKQFKSTLPNKSASVEPNGEAEEEEENGGEEKQGKKAKDKTASTLQLPGEPMEPKHADTPDKVGSSQTQQGEIARFQNMLKICGGYIK